MKTLRIMAVASLCLSPLRPVSLGAASPSWQEELAFYATEAPVVVTASLKSQKLDEVPGTMTVITDKDIKALGLQTLNQALGLIPGFHLIQESYGPMNVVVRGYKFSAGHVKFMLDGHSLNNTDHKGMEVWQDMPLDDVKQIEIIRGPGSSLYGSDAFMAVVNVITRKEAGGKISGTGGTLGRWGTAFSHNSDPGKDLSWRVSFNQFGERGSKYLFEKDWLSGSPLYDPLSATPITKRKKQDRFDAGAVVARGGLSLTARHAQNQKEWSEGFVHIVSPERSFITTRDSFVEAEYKHSFSGETALTLKGSFNEDYLNYTHHTLPPNFPIGYGALGGYAESWILGHRYNGQASWETILGRHSLTAGVEYGYQYIPEAKNLTNYDASLVPLPGGMVLVDGQDPRHWTLAEHTHEEHWGVYAQDILDLSPVTLILGARYDQYQLAGHAFAPRVALIWEAPAGQIVKTSFGQAFFAPYVAARYTQAFGFKGDPKLEPELVKTYDVSIQNAFATRAHYVVTGFVNEISNAFRFTSTRLPPLSAYYNEGEQRFYGAELEGRWDIRPSLGLWGNFSFAKGYDEVIDTGSAFPRRLANVGLISHPLEAMTVSVSGQFTGKTLRSRPGQTGHIPGWGSLNASVGYQVGGSFELQLSGQNLLDHERFSYNNQGFIPAAYGSASSLTGGNDFPLSGRQVFFKGVYTFGKEGRSQTHK